MLQQELVHHEPGPLLRQVTHFGGDPARNKKISVQHESEKKALDQNFNKNQLRVHCILLTLLWGTLAAK